MKHWIAHLLGWGTYEETRYIEAESEDDARTQLPEPGAMQYWEIEEDAS